MVCAARGYRAHLVTADCFAIEKIQTMRAFGAAVEVLESDGGKVTPELFDRFKARIAELVEDPDTWWAEQFINPGDAMGYRALGREIVEELGDGIDGFVMGVGTGGCFSGVAEVLKSARSSVRCVAVEPSTSRNLSGGPLGGHRLKGIGVGFNLPAPGWTWLTRSAPSPTRRRSRRHGRWPGKKGSWRDRPQGPTSSPLKGSRQSSARADAS
jgi:cysteine synthase